MAEERPAGGLRLQTLKRTSDGRVETMQIGAVFFRHRARSRLGLASTTLRFSFATVKWSLQRSGMVRVGLCQYGADGMAKAGKTFQEILQYTIGRGT